MKPSPLIGQPAPLLSVSDWVQGEPVNFDQLHGHVVLVEFFQVNCPGCFLTALPQAIGLYRQYAEQGLTVFGVATAFEDFDKNTLENLITLAENGIVIGETKRLLGRYGKLADGKLPYRIPFALAMDKLRKLEHEITAADVVDFIHQHIPLFEQQSVLKKDQLQRQVWQYLQARLYTAESFDRYQLQGTPSQIVVDKHGCLRASEFGSFSGLEELLQKLLNE